MRIILCFKNQLLFIVLNKMTSFFEGQTSRAERLQKQQIYKNMLDQQLQYQNINKDSQASKQKTGLNKSGLSQPYDYNFSKNVYQPHKRLRYSRNIPTSKTRIHTQPEQEGEKYLQSCEQIIKNLKSLTIKRKQKELQLLRLQSKLNSDYKSKKPEQEQISRYLLSRNSDSFYKDRQQSDKKRQKYLLKPLRIDEPLSKSTQYGKSIKINPSKKKLKNFQPLQRSNRQQSSKSRSKSKEKQANHQTNPMNPQQKQVYDTMIELMKYFKAKQEEIQKQKNKQKLVSSQVQVDPIQDKQPVDKKRQQSNESALKLKALVKLRQLNLKSRQLFEKLKKAREEQNQSKYQKRKPQTLKQHRLKTRLEDEIKKKKTQQQQINKSRQKNQNEQLLKAIASQLNKQQQQNVSLTNCLRELSRFLNDQNQEIEILRQSQIQVAKKLQPKNQNKQLKNKSKNNQLPKFRAEEFPKIKKNTPPSPKKQKPKIQRTKQQQDKLKQAFLKKLKKLRLKGKQFNDKVQTYKKQYQSQNSQYQQQQKQQQQQQQRNPQMESQSPRDLKLTKQQV